MTYLVNVIIPVGEHDRVLFTLGKQCGMCRAYLICLIYLLLPLLDSIKCMELLQVACSNFEYL